MTATNILDVAKRAAGRIAPLWPLSTFVAVNPFLGLADHPFTDAAARMARVAGARSTMPRAYYLEAVECGRIAPGDLAAALAEAARTDLPRDPAAFLDLARGDRTPPPAPLATVADVATRATGRDWAGFLLERLSAFLADQFDEGQAAWTDAGRGDGLYANWRTTAAHDRSPDVAGLAGLRAAIARLPDTPHAVFAMVPARLGIAPEGLELYFHRLLMTIGGWAAYVRGRVWQSELAGESDERLVELLAILLAADLAVLEALGADAGVAAGWQAAARAFADAPRDDRAIAIDAILQAAFDKGWQRDLAGRLSAERAPAPARRPAVQAAFCIDVRSEVYRRALEATSPDIDTIGFAGFFGFAIEYVPLGHAHGGARCPVLLSPGLTVAEAVRDAGPAETGRILKLRMVRRRAAKAWKSFKLAAVSSFTFVETIGLGYAAKLVMDTLGLSRTVPHPDVEGLSGDVQDRLVPAVEPGEIAGRATGVAVPARIDMAEAVLRAMSMTGPFARLVVLAGHGSTTVNNPHASGLDCGACGGHTGEANARFAVRILNDPAVRAALPERGIAIPEDTVFVAALHDTTTDEVRLFDEADVPASHAEDLAALKAHLAEAGRRTRAERAALLHIAGGEAIDTAILFKSRNWAEVRPEWGLAGCAAFIAAPRERTTGLDLDGRSFLHDYRWQDDAGFGTLELIMTAPMVVASWISLQYYGSTVDNVVFGSGNKVLHNVVGTIGVLEGNGGDLRTGLPWQSVHDGERFVHEPVRLAVAIEAPREAMLAVIAKHEGVRHLLDNGWLNLFSLDDKGRIEGRYVGGLSFADVAPGTAEPAAVRKAEVELEVAS